MKLEYGYKMASTDAVMADAAARARTVAKQVILQIDDDAGGDPEQAALVLALVQIHAKALLAVTDTDIKVAQAVLTATASAKRTCN